MPKVVLLVDDDPSVIDLLVNILNLLGVETQVAHNGRDALNAIKATPPDAVILDLMMPVMDGFTMLSQLRKEEVGQKMPVIVLSALADQKGMMERLPGIIGTITKGRFSLLDLREMLGKAGIPLDGAPAQPAPSAQPAAAQQTPALPPAAVQPSQPVVVPPVSQPANTAAPIKAEPSVPAPTPAPVPVTPPTPAPITALPQDTTATPPLGIPRPANGHTPTNGSGNGSKPTS